MKKKTKRGGDDLKITKGGISVWHDLGYPNADEMVYRCELADKLAKENGTKREDEFRKLCSNDRDEQLEKKKLVSVTLEIPKKMYKAIEKVCEEDGITMQEFVLQAIQFKVDDRTLLKWATAIQKEKKV